MNKNKFTEWFAEHKYISILLLVIFLERIYVMCTLGVDYNLGNDDMAYISGAIRFWDKSIVTYPTAVAMPGIVWLIAIFIKVFGQEQLFWISIKLFWIICGTLTALFVYLTVKMFVPKWCALLAAGCFLAPNVAWMDNLIMTETPYFMCFTLLVYLTFLMVKTNHKGVFAIYCVAYMCGLLLRPTIGIMPVFSLGYLFLMKVDRKLLFRRMIIGGVVLAMFLVPWTIRNYIHFDHFIPLTAGGGNPTQQGTYQGFGYPSDEELDYEENVERVWREEYAEYLDEDGNVIDPVMETFLGDKKLAIKADYRMRVWWENNPISMMLSYLVIKPGIMLIKTFYWQEVLATPELLLDALRAVNFFLCCGAVLLSFKQKRLRMEMGFLCVVYWFYIYLFSMTYSFSRYGETLMNLRYCIMGIGFMLMLQEWQNWKQKRTKESSVLGK